MKLAALAMDEAGPRQLCRNRLTVRSGKSDGGNLLSANQTKRHLYSHGDVRTFVLTLREWDFGHSLDEDEELHLADFLVRFLNAAFCRGPLPRAAVR